MSGGCIWEPFEIDEGEYRELVAELQRRGRRRRGYGWGSYDVLEPPSAVRTYDDWEEWLHNQAAEQAVLDGEWLEADVATAERSLALASSAPDCEDVPQLERQLWDAQRRLTEWLLPRWKEWLASRGELDEFLAAMDAVTEAERSMWQARAAGRVSEVKRFARDVKKSHNEMRTFLRRHPRHH